MNYRELQQRSAFLARQAGSDKVAPQPDWPTLVNRAIQDFSWDSEYNIEEESITSVVNQSTYTIDGSASPRPFKSYRVVAYATQSTTPNNLIFTNENDRYNEDTLWWQRPVGTPNYFLVPASNQIRLFPTPSTAGDTVTIRGTREDVPLVDDTDTPNAPGTYHEAIALRATVLHCEPWVSGDDAAKLELFRSQYGGLVRDCMEFLSGNRYARLQRRVDRPFRRRTFIRLSGHY